MSNYKFGMIQLVVVLTVVVISIGLLLYNYYVILEAHYYNQKIEVSGVKFLMTEDELKNSKDGEFVYGMGGNGWRFNDMKVFVMTSSIGLFQDKVCLIETENESHLILGIRVGENYNNAVQNLINQGFKEISQDYFGKGNVKIFLSGETIIGRIRINIQDPAYKDAVF